MWEKLKEWRLAGADLTTIERREVLEDLFVFGEENQVPFYKRMAYLLIVSTLIACCGLMADSAAVVIGAMLVAPMMRPVMISAAAITLGWSQYLYQALLLTLAMALCAVGIAALFALLSPQIIEIPGQVLARTAPTYFDLVIALVAGSGGAYTMTHKESGAIPGVAMAVALLPPLASTGILLVFLEHSLALKAFILFFTNFAAMVLAATLTFLYLGISPRKARIRSARLIRNYLMGFFVLVVGVSIPLYFFSTEVWYDASYKANQSPELQAWLQENELLIDDVQIDDEQRIVYLKLLGPNPPLSVETLHTELQKAHFTKVGKQPAPFSIRVLWTQTAEFSWPPVSTLLADERVLEQDYTVGMLGYTWYWIGTQYANGGWLRPQTELISSYSISAKADASLALKTHCTDGLGSYELRQEDLSASLDAAVADDCETSKIDNRFITDLNNAINVEIDGDHMTLRLDSNVGVMHFQSNLPQ
ncbi:MAG: TIGR00341 family protein [Gammaproteobacteria bacterium]